MKLNKYLFGGTVAIGVACGSGMVLADNIDTFDTFTSTYATGASGFVLGLAGTGSAVDNTEGIFSTGDSDFTNLTRKVTLSSAVAGGQSDVYNGTAPSTAQGYLKWGNVSKISSVELLYTFPIGSYLSGKNLTSFSQFNLDWDVFELGASVAIQVTSAVGAEGSITTSPTAVPVMGANFLQSIAYSSFTGGGASSAVWDSVRSIKFTLTTTYNDLDIALDNISLSNPNVPEASTAIPAIGFAGLIGVVAWKRRQAK